LPSLEKRRGKSLPLLSSDVAKKKEKRSRRYLLEGGEEERENA